jgi:hypothetical protein
VAKASRNRRRAAAVKARRTRTGSPVWYAATGIVIIAGVLAVVMSRGSNAEVAPFPNDPESHWHAALGVKVCGTWLPNAPEFHQRSGSSLQAGLHSHGDGLVHVHPYSSDEAGKRATLGKYFDEGGWELSEDSFTAWDNQEHKSGDDCDGKEAEVRWEVNGEPRSGDPGDYKVENGDEIAVALLPEGEEIGRPPSAGTTPTDLGPTDTTPSSPPAGESTAPPGSTVPPGSSAPTQSSVPSESTVPPSTSASPTSASSAP